MEQIVRLQQLADFDHGAMDDRIGDSGTEKSGLELSTFLEVLRPFAARLWKSKVGVWGQRGGRCVHAPRAAASATRPPPRNPPGPAATGSDSAAACPNTVCSSR